MNPEQIEKEASAVVAGFVAARLTTTVLGPFGLANVMSHMPPRMRDEFTEKLIRVCGVTVRVEPEPDAARQIAQEVKRLAEGAG